MIEVVKNFNRFYFEGFRPSKYCDSVFKDKEGLSRVSETLEEIEDVWTAFEQNNPIAVFGFIPQGPKRSEVFAFIEKGVGSKLIGIFRAMKKEIKIKLTEVDRIESYIAADDKYLHRWMQSLGFTLECERMFKRGDSGEDQSLYVMLGGA